MQADSRVVSVDNWLSNPTVRQGIAAASGLVFIYLVVLVLRLLINRYIHDSAVRYHTHKLIIISAYLLAIILILAVFWRRLSGFTVFLGIAEAGIAVALREVILSIAGWLTITLRGLYKAGDRIEIAGRKGDVIDISILHTTIMEIGQWVNSDLCNGRIVRITNSFVF